MSFMLVSNGLNTKVCMCDIDHIYNLDATYTYRYMYAIYAHILSH